GGVGAIERMIDAAERWAEIVVAFSPTDRRHVALLPPARKSPRPGQGARECRPGRGFAVPWETGSNVAGHSTETGRVRARGAENAVGNGSCLDAAKWLGYFRERPNRREDSTVATIAVARACHARPRRRGGGRGLARPRPGFLSVRHR